MFFSSNSKFLPVLKPISLAVLASCLITPVLAQENEEENLIPVVVTASRIEQSQKDAIASTTVITQEMIKNSQAFDLPDLLRNVAGLSIGNNGGAGQTTSIFMRGTESRHLLILLDGVPLTDSTSIGPTIQFQHILPEQIERIEIVRGNVSAIYGSGAIGGVIQIFTKKGEGKPNVNASAEIGTDTTIKLSGGVSGDVDGTRYAVSATRFKTNGFSAINPNQDVTANGDSDGTRDVAFNAALSKEWRKGQEVGVRLYGFDAKTDYDGWSGGSSGKDWTESKLMSFAAFTKNRITSDWLSTVTASHTTSKTEYFYSLPNSETQDNSYFRGETSMLQWANEIALSSDWILSAGADIEREKAEVIQYGFYASSMDQSRTNYDFYAGLTGKIDKHNFQVNARYDHVEDSGSDITGYFGYGYDLTSNWKLIASASTAFLAPTLYQQFDPSYGNKNLKAERSRSFEAGIQYANNKTLVRAVAFETRTHDLISILNNKYTNIKEAKIKGIELNGSTQLAGVDVHGNFTWQLPENRETGEQLERRPKKIASLNVSKNIGRWFVGGDLHYEDYRHDMSYSSYPYSPVVLGSYTLLNLNVRYQLTKEVELFGRIENAFDKEYQTAYTYNQLGRAFFGGISWKM